MEEPHTSTDTSHTEHHLPLSARDFVVILLALVAGFAGGRFGVISQDSLSTTETQQFILSESQLIESVVENVSPSVVSITVETSGSGGFGFSGVGTGAGTGIVLSEDGLILTNRHVVEGSENIQVITSDGTRHENVQLVDADPFNDIAFLQIPNVSGLKPATLGVSDEMKVGAKVIAIGNALGEFQNTVTTGIISGLARPLSGLEDGDSLSNLFQTDAAINPGNSGGPLLNINGEVIGVNTAIAGQSEGIGFAIPIDDVKPAIKTVQESGEIIKPYVGVRFITLTPRIAEEFDLPVKQGVYLIGSGVAPAVLKNSPAAKAGVKAEDIIVSIDGAELTESTSLSSIIARKSVGDVVTLGVVRGEERLEIEVTLEAAPF